MPGLKKRLCKNIFLFALSFSIVSCAAFDSSKNPAGSNKLNYSDQTKILQIESELQNAKKSHANLNLQIKEQNSIIKNLQEKIFKLENHILFSKTIKFSNPAEHYEKARTLLIEKNLTGANKLFTEFIKNYPKDNLADNAFYWLGECHYSLRNYKKAIPLKNTI